MDIERVLGEDSVAAVEKVGYFVFVKSPLCTNFHQHTATEWCTVSYLLRGFEVPAVLFVVSVFVKGAVVRVEKSTCEASECVDSGKEAMMKIFP